MNLFIPKAHFLFGCSQLVMEQSPFPMGYSQDSLCMYSLWDTVRIPLPGEFGTGTPQKPGRDLLRTVLQPEILLMGARHIVRFEGSHCLYLHSPLYPSGHTLCTSDSFLVILLLPRAGHTTLQNILTLSGKVEHGIFYDPTILLFYVP